MSYASVEQSKVTMTLPALPAPLASANFPLSVLRRESRRSPA